MSGELFREAGRAGPQLRRGGRLVEKALRFTAEDAEHAWNSWGANCGPGAIAAVCGLTLEELRPQMGSFERKGYTNPTLMWEVLDRIGVAWRPLRPPSWPLHGLVRVQWEGPWTKSGVPAAARYRHTHWIGARRGAGVEIFDINAIEAGGWIAQRAWSDVLVPFLLREAVPRADGRWHLTHAVEVRPSGVPFQ